MINMSYCMFENTKLAIRELNNAFYDNEVDLEEMSTDERGAFYTIMEEARTLIENVESMQED